MYKMRVGRKHTKVVEVRQTRSCVVRLEKVSTASPNISPSLEENRILTRTHRLTSMGLAPTPKTRRAANLQKEETPNSGTAKKKVVSGGSNIPGSMQTSQQQKATNSTISNVRSNQKIKVVAKSNKETSVPTPSKEESPPPTIAAGRSRRAIKPNPKYASEDLVTPKVVRNVGLLGSTAGRGGTTAQNKTREASTSSDDFYNRNSEDETSNRNADNDSHNDKAYQASEKDDNDSDFSVVEESNKRNSRLRSRPKRNQESALGLTLQHDNKLPTQTRSTATTTANSSNLRSAPSQLQQIRRSLANANAQRNFNIFVGSNVGSAQKRKIEEIQDSSDNESNYSLKRKQLVHSNSLVNKIKLPVKENKVSATSTPLNKNRLIAQTQIQKPATQQTINGSNKINSLLTSSRRAIEIAVKSNSEFIAKSSIKQPLPSSTMNQHNKPFDKNSATTQPKILASKTHKLRSASPKPTVQKEKQSNNGTIVSSIASAYSNSSSVLKTDCKIIEKGKAFNSNQITKPTISIPPHNLSAIRSEIVHEIKDDSPNSTMDDFETMPTFTIVNVNDIINKKGDVLITKSKSNSSKSHTVIELSESISLDDDDDDEDNRSLKDDIEEVMSVLSASSRQKQVSSKKLPKPPSLHTRNEIESKKSTMTQSNEQRKVPTLPPASTTAPKQAPQILNHKLGLRNSRVAAKTTTTLTATLTPPDKPAPRILNSVVAKKTQPVKPMIANMDDSADESFHLSLDEDEDAEGETEDEIESKNSTNLIMSERPRRRDYRNLMEIDTEDTDSQNTEDDDTILQPTKTTHAQVSPKVGALAPKQNTNLQPRGRTVAPTNNQIIVSSNQKRLTPAAAKENSLAATNHQVNDTNTKQSTAPTLPVRKSNTEKVVISKQGDKIIKKITCFETWYVINMPADAKRPVVIKNQLEMPLVQLANQAKNICLPNNMWSSKVTLYELSPQSLVKGTYATFTGDLYEHNISEEDRGKYQPSCVMFRRSIEKSLQSRMPYDRAVIFKNKTFYTNIEGKNIRLLGAPSIINCETEIEILLEIVDSLNLQSDFVELVSVMQ